jgi:hypothetical protein
MNTKENNSSHSDTEDGKTQKEIDIKDLKLPFDMKSFWKNVNEKYFKNINDLNVHEINHLVHSFSKYGIYLYNLNLDINNDQIFTKIGFPKTLNCLVGKTFETLASN